MAKKNANSGGKTSLPDPPTYDASTNSQAKEELENNTADSSSASMPGVDLSKYRQPQLVEALDRLTSFTYAGSLLLKPALKIMWRSALYQDADVRLQDLLTQLKGTSPITEPPTPSGSSNASAAGAATASAQSKKSQASSKPARSIAERFVHFFCVGIPMAVLVGLAYGIVNFVTCIFGDIKTVTSTSQNLFNQAKVDLNHYYTHPETRPTKDQAIDAWTQQIVQPYTQTIVKRKLGPFGFGFIAAPIAGVVQSVVRVFANSSATELQKYAKKYKGFEVFKDSSVQAS